MRLDYGFTRRLKTAEDLLCLYSPISDLHGESSNLSYKLATHILTLDK